MEIIKSNMVIYENMKVIESSIEMYGECWILEFFWHYIKVWSSKLLAIIWVENITDAIYVEFWLPTIEEEISWNPIPKKCNIQWCNVGQTRTTLLSIPFITKTEKVKLWNLLTGVLLGSSWNFQDLWTNRNYANKKVQVICRKNTSNKNMKFIVSHRMIPVKPYFAIGKKLQ